MAPLISLLARQAATWWCGSPPVHDDSREEQDALTAATLSTFALRSAALMQEEGVYSSMVTPGLKLPAGGPTSMDIVAAATAHTLNGWRAVPFTVHWQVSDKEACEAGAWRTPLSVALVPDVPAELMAAVFAELPSELRPRPDDTVTSLTHRLASSTYLDDANVAAGGRGTGGKTVRINATDHRMPRRRSCSVRGSPEDSHEGSRLMYSYTQFRRPSHDLSAFPMTPAQFDLGTCCWLAARAAGRLSQVSQQAPFNHCQLLFYYTTFNSHMRQHRDNNNVHDFVKAADAVLAGKEPETSANGNCTGVEGVNSQAPGSSVAIFAMGNVGMTCRLRFADKANPGQKRGDYPVHPRFSMRLGPGTMFILDPIDDLFYTHEAQFEVWDLDQQGWRVAFVFRNCITLLPFETEGNCKFWEEPVKTAERVKRNRARRSKKRARERDQLMKGPW
tara:strand:+ start:21 stop:1361 length:1341 start_codon:yes stop_codon:yes gene_type:complete